jgi:hypothetical protein
MLIALKAVEHANKQWLRLTYLGSTSSMC